jgi:charged multivesicular body protein 1
VRELRRCSLQWKMNGRICERESEKQKALASNYIKLQQMEEARMCCQESVHQRGLGLKWRQTSYKIDNVVDRLQTAIMLKQYGDNLEKVTKIMKKIIDVQDPTKLDTLSGDLGKILETFEVQSNLMQKTIEIPDSSNQLEEGTNLFTQLQEENSLDLNIQSILEYPHPPLWEPQQRA